MKDYEDTGCTLNNLMPERGKKKKQLHTQNKKKQTSKQIKKQLLGKGNHNKVTMIYFPLLLGILCFILGIPPCFFAARQCLVYHV